MAKTIAIALQKGGSAKTTTAVNLAADLHDLHQKRVLLVDMDSQANATFYSGVDSADLDASLFNLLTTEDDYRTSLKETILQTEHYDLVPADRDVADLAKEVADVAALKILLANIKTEYDYIILDVLPSLNIISQMAFAAADYLVIPTETKPFNFTGLVDLNDEVNAVNQDIVVLGILLVRYHARTKIDNLVKEEIVKESGKLNTTCFDTIIREGVAVQESQLAREPLCGYAPRSNPAQDYRTFTEELLQRIGDEE